MSGYHREEGVFELTGTKAHYWLRREKFPPECEGKTGMALYAELLRHNGHEVTKLNSTYLHVRATPGQVWEALSGQPSDPEREKHYLSRSAPGSVRKPATLKEQTPDGVHLLPADAIALFRSGSDGSGQPIAKALASGRGTCRICGKVIEKGLECVQGGWDFSNGRRGVRPTKCYLHMECLAPVGPVDS